MAEISVPVQVQSADTVALASRRPRRNNTFQIITYIVLTIAALVYVLPFVWMAAKSVMNLLEANSTAIIPGEIHLENYTYVLTEVGFGQFFWNTVRIAFL